MEYTDLNDGTRIRSGVGYLKRSLLMKRQIVKWLRFLLIAHVLAFISCEEEILLETVETNSCQDIGDEELQKPIYESNGLRYMVEGPSASVVGTMQLSDDGEVTIPDTLGGYPVTAIGDRAFANDSTIISVTLPDSVTSIGEGAFRNCVKLQSVFLSENIETIGREAFCYCKALSVIDFPEGLKTVEDNAFYACSSLRTMTIPASLVYGSFNYSGLTSVRLTDGIAIVPCFAYCEGITELDIPDSVVEIQDDAFYETGITDIKLPSGLKRIGKNAFKRQWFDEKGLAKIDFPESLEYIGESAFENSNIEEVKIPPHVKSLSDFAFRGCQKLKKIEFLGTELKSIGDYCFEVGDYYYPNMVKILHVPVESINLPDGLLELGQGAFYGLKISEINIPSSVKTIGNSCFASIYTSNKNLGNVHIGCNMAEGMGGWIFNGRIIDEMEFGESVTKIDSNVIGKLTVNTLRLPKALKEIVLNFQDSNMGRWLNVKNLYVRSAFRLTNGEFSALWESWWGTVDDSLNVYFSDECTGIDDYAFCNCKFTSIEFPRNLKRIGAYAFSNTTFPEGTSLQFDEVESLEDGAFYNAKNIKSFEMESCRYMSSGAFESTKIDTVKLGAGVETCSIGAYNTTINMLEVNSTEIGLAKIPELTEVVIGPNVKRICANAFAEDTKLTKVSPMQNVTSVGYRAFLNCSAVESFEFRSENPVYIAGSAFLNCKNASFSFNGEVALTETSSKAFIGCINLTELPTLSGKIIPSYAFAGTGLTDASIPNTVSILGNDAFSECASLKSIYLPESLEDLGGYTFYKCIALETIKTAVSGDVVRKYSPKIFSNDKGIKSIIIIYDAKTTTEAVVKQKYMDGTQYVELEEQGVCANGFYSLKDKFSFQKK